MKLMCIGDSLTYGFGVPREAAWTYLIEKEMGCEVINRGICGDTTGGMIARAYADLNSLKPSHMMIIGGTNDLIFDVPVEVIMANLSALVFHAISNGAIPILGTPIPVLEQAADYWKPIKNVSCLNENIKKLCVEAEKFSACHNINFINLFRHFENADSGYYFDGLHLTDEGNRFLSRLIYNGIKGLQL